MSDAKTPQKGEDLEELWRSDLHNGNVMMNHISAPAYYNGFVYYSLNDTIVKVDAETGETLASCEAAKSGMLLPQVTVGGGKVFVMTLDSASGGCRIKVYSADTLEFLYQTVSLSGAQIETPIMYHDGYFYFATYGSKGAYYAFVAPDEKQTKDLNPEWQKKATGTVGYVWAGMEFIGEDIGVFGDTNANLFSVNRITGEVLDTYVFPEGTQIQSTPNYYEKNQRLYVTTAMNGGSILSIKMNSDGTFDRSSEKWFISDLGGSGIKSSPVIYNDRLYVCGGGGHGGSNEPFRVIDANTMTVIYEIEELGSKGTPVLSTAYATEENGHKVYLYVVPYKPDSTTSAMYIIQDSQGQTEPIYEKVDNIGSKQYCSQTITIGDNGLMYYYNDANYVYAYGLKDLNSRLITGEDVDQQIKRMPEVDEYKYYNDVEIKRIKERYDNLSDSEKQKVTLYQKLIDILAISYMSPVERMNSGIEAIPDIDQITLENRDMIENLYQGYYRMEEADRLLVENPDKLLTAYAQIPILEKKVITDAIIADIDKLPEVSELGIANKTAVDSLLQRVGALDDTDKTAITNMDKLNSAKERVDAIEAQLAKVDQLILDSLEGLTITLENKGLVDAIDQAAQGLSMEDLRTLENYEYYVSPAKVAIINALIESNNISSDLKVTKENADSLQAVIDEITKYFGGVLEDDVKYLKGYPGVSAVQTKINAVKNSPSDDNTDENPSEDPGDKNDPATKTPDDTTTVTGGTTKTPSGTTRTAGGTSKSVTKASKTGDFEPIAPMFICMLTAAAVLVTLRKRQIIAK